MALAAIGQNSFVLIGVSISPFNSMEDFEEHVSWHGSSYLVFLML